jgi:hypothetical protein
MGADNPHNRRYGIWAGASGSLLRHADGQVPFVCVPGPECKQQSGRACDPSAGDDPHTISGGSCSAEGTRTRMALASVFEAW